MSFQPPRIHTCPEWGARQPRMTLELVGQASRIIFHHTAGHVPELGSSPTRNLEEAYRYARAIQRFHMETQGWVDSGHNFLVTRSGLIVQGRWLTVGAIQAGRMVRSAHCPGQNEQIGIEHEHVGTEPMTQAQRRASALLMAWVSAQYRLRTILPVEPHSRYVATSCPANLRAEIPGLRRLALELLRA